MNTENLNNFELRTNQKPETSPGELGTWNLELL
jgi:hypothetical protein